MVYKVTRLLVVAILGLSLAFPSASTAEKFGSLRYSGGKSFEFLDLPGYYGYGESTETLIEVNASGGGGIDLLGCGAVDIFSFMNIQYQIADIIENFTQYMKTMVAKWLLTQLFSSPQLGAIFDTLQAFGNARLDMFKANCDIGQIRADAKRQAVDYCIEEKTKTLGREAAVKNCTENASKSTADKLVEAADKLLNFQAINSKVNDVLRETAACGASEKDGACFLATIASGFRLCGYRGVGNKRNSKGGCIGGRGAEQTSQVIKYPTLFSAANEVFYDGIYNVLDEVASEVVTKYSLAQIDMALDNLASKQSSDAGKITMSQYQFFKYDLDPVQFGALSEKDSQKLDKIVEEFIEFKGCGKSEDGGIIDPFAPTKMFLKELNLIKDTGVKITHSEQDLENMAKGLSQIIDLKGSSDAKKQAGLDIQQAAKLLNVGVVCVANHDIHASMSMLIKMKKLPIDDQAAILRATSLQASKIFIRSLMEFVKYQLEKAGPDFDEWANEGVDTYYADGGCDKASKMISRKKGVEKGLQPCDKEKWKHPAIKTALEMMLKQLDIQMKAMESREKERKGWADMMALMEKRADALIEERE
ncbi:MAG: hypothetical protein OXR68_06665 [Alphaproteobacteria bacterium]|nr:hypothetical protein [Alphaproteobacteria bacterium]MDD9920286.1 hypothetical protein [Alphaproteobacteria bacterium]